VTSHKIVIGLTLNVLNYILCLTAEKFENPDLRDGEHWAMRSFMICTFHEMFIISKGDEVGGACNMHGDMRTAHKILVGKPGKEETTEKIL
jgi:hypothetical protein